MMPHTEPGALKVGDVMTRDPAVVGPDTPLREAAGLMRTKGFRHLPVVDTTRHLLGIITDRDITHAAFVPLLADYLAWDPHRLKAPRVRDVMTWSVVTTHPDTPLVQAGLRMFQRRIGSLPVVQDRQLVGILTDRDVATAFRKARHLETADDAFLW
jgi:acetoin utilization protein AcuB